MYLEIGRSESFIHAMITDSRSYDPKTMKACISFVELEMKTKIIAPLDKFQVFHECKSVDEQEYFSCWWNSMKNSDLQVFFDEVEVAYNRSNSDANELGAIPDEFLGKLFPILMNRNSHPFV
jgi:hypothetical protein